jgi:hypothetical protein
MGNLMMWMRCCVVLCGVCLLPNMGYAAPKKPVVAESNTQAAGKPITLNSIAQAAANGGVSKCLERMNQVTSFVASDSKNGALLFLAPSEADTHVSSVSLEVQTPTALSFVDTQFSPNANNACGGAYEAITYWNNTCQEVATNAFGTFKVAKPLRQSIAVLDGGQSVRVFLMAAGQGCISIKKEVLY